MSKRYKVTRYFGPTPDVKEALMEVAPDLFQDWKRVDVSFTFRWLWLAKLWATLGRKQDGAVTTFWIEIEEVEE